MNCPRHVNNLFSLLGMICFALGETSCDRVEKSTNAGKDDSSVRRPATEESPSRKELIDYSINRIDFDFEAVDLPLSEVLSMAEAKFNSRWGTQGINKLKLSSRNNYDRQITIVLKVVTLRLLLDLIDLQTGFGHRIDYDRREIVFFFDTDIIDDDDHTETGKGDREYILPPIEEHEHEHE